MDPFIWMEGTTNEIVYSFEFPLAGLRVLHWIVKTREYNAVDAPDSHSNHACTIQGTKFDLCRGKWDRPVLFFVVMERPTMMITKDLKTV